MCPLWSDENLQLFLMFALKFSTFEEKIEAPLTHVLSPGASIRENTVYNVTNKIFCVLHFVLFGDTKIPACVILT